MVVKRFSNGTGRPDGVLILRCEGDMPDGLIELCRAWGIIRDDE